MKCPECSASIPLRLIGEEGQCKNCGCRYRDNQQTLWLVATVLSLVIWPIGSFLDSESDVINAVLDAVLLGVLGFFLFRYWYRVEPISKSN